jgi:hypothetical protein
VRVGLGEGREKKYPADGTPGRALLTDWRADKRR